MAVIHKREWFLHELGDLLDVEVRLAQMLPELAQEVQDLEIKNAFSHHAAEAQQQARNLERCFALLGVQPEYTASFFMERLRKEHDQFLHNQPSSTFLAMFDVKGIARTVRYKIASYQGLITQAYLMGQRECLWLLQQNLKQEESMAQTLALFSRELEPQLRPE